MTFSKRYYHRMSFQNCTSTLDVCPYWFSLFEMTCSTTIGVLVCVSYRLIFFYALTDGAFNRMVSCPVSHGVAEEVEEKWVLISNFIRYDYLLFVLCLYVLSEFFVPIGISANFITWNYCNNLKLSFENIKKINKLK